MPKKVVTTEEAPEQREQPGTLEQWVAEIAAKPEVVMLRVYRRGPTGRWVRLAPDVLPPFSFDPAAYYDRYGDGLYKFMAIGKSGKVVETHHEDVSGYGYGTESDPFRRAGLVADAGGVGSSDEGEEVSLRDLIQMERERLLLETLRSTRKPGEASSDVDRMVALLGSLTSSLAAAVQPLVTVLGSKMDATAQVLQAVLPRLTQEPQPVDKLIEAMSKVLDLRERVSEFGGGDGGIGEYLRPVLAGLAAELGRRLMLPGAPVPSAPTPSPPVMMPAPAAPAPAPMAPTEPAPVAPQDSGGAQAAQSEPVVPTWLVAAIVDAASRHDEEWDLWADLIEHRWPGALDLWRSVPVEQWLAQVATLAPDLGRPDVQDWLRRFRAALDADQPLQK